MMCAFRKRLLLTVFVISVLITQMATSAFSAEKVIGQIKEIGNGKIILDSNIIVLIEGNVAIENEDGASISYSKLAVKDMVAVEGSRDNKTIRANKIKKLAH